MRDGCVRMRGMGRVARGCAVALIFSHKKKEQTTKRNHFLTAALCLKQHKHEQHTNLPQGTLFFLLLSSSFPSLLLSIISRRNHFIPTKNHKYKISFILIYISTYHLASYDLIFLPYIKKYIILYFNINSYFSSYNNMIIHLLNKKLICCRSMKT